MLKPPQPGWAKFVAPREDRTPSALAGPGVSSPTARHRGPVHPGDVQDLRERGGQRLDGDVRALADPARPLQHVLDQELA